METIETTQDAYAQLSRPFDRAEIRQLPKPTCPDCIKKQCVKHKPVRCSECGSWITPAHIHIDYVGHAAVTRRLGEVDPGWNWAPVAFTDDGLPLFTRDREGQPVGLWIHLTVLGVTRYGYGTVKAGKSDAEKQLIGDAIRNAAMRFGVAIQQWIGDETSADAAAADDGKRSASQVKNITGEIHRARSDTVRQPPSVDSDGEDRVRNANLRRSLSALLNTLPEEISASVREDLRSTFGPAGQLTERELLRAIQHVRQVAEANKVAS